MFYFLLKPIMTFNFILIAAAVIPAVFLMLKVYRSDRLEKESKGLLLRLVRGGILSSLLALVEERILSAVLGRMVDENTLLYNIILYFIVVAVSEESSKYIFLRRNSWNSVEFNSRFDGVVYAVFTSLGFALWENISYVMTYGFRVAIVRAVTAIPGHACFGVFMGVFYGLARMYYNRREYSLSKICRVMSVIIPVFLHGTYDFIATMEETVFGLYFIAFVSILFVVSYIVVSKESKTDEFIV